MKPQFNEKRATQIACLLLQRRNGRMNILSLMKLMYLIDRKALVKWGWSLTDDDYYSMPRGMVLSKTYNLIHEEPIAEKPIDPTSLSYWKAFISAPQDYNVNLIDEPGLNELSQADIDLVNEIYEEFGHLNRFALVRIHHELPEWEETKKNSKFVDYEKVLQVSDKSEEEISEIIGEMDVLSQLEQITIEC